MFNGYRVSVWDDVEVLEMEGGDGCTTMYLMPLNCTLQMVEMIDFMLCILNTKTHMQSH